MSSTLANRMRPQNLKDIIGQQHLVGPNAILTKFVQKSHPFSIILYGSPGCGKTTIAMALAMILTFHIASSTLQPEIKKKWMQLLKKLS